MQIPQEMSDRDVIVFEGLRTPEGRAIAQGFLDQYATAGWTEAFDFPDVLVIPAQERSYPERTDAARHAPDQQRLVDSTLAPLADGGDLTPHKVLVIADLLQLGHVVTGVNEKVYRLLPNAYKSDEAAMEDFGSVSQTRSFDAMRLYGGGYTTESGTEWIVDSLDPRGYRQRVEEITRRDVGRNTFVSTTDLAERCIKDPLEPIRALLEITQFVRESNEATMGFIAEHYAPKLHQSLLEAEATRLAGDAIVMARAAAAQSGSRTGG